MKTFHWQGVSQYRLKESLWFEARKHSTNDTPFDVSALELLFGKKKENKTGGSEKYEENVNKQPKKKTNTKILLVDGQEHLVFCIDH